MAQRGQARTKKNQLQLLPPLHKTQPCEPQPTFLLCLLLQLAVALVDGRLSGVHQLNCTAPRSKGARLQQ
jgi:hypothetical protein